MALYRALLSRGKSASASRFACKSRSWSIFSHAADQFVMEIPEEHEGLNYEFNWSLADDDVTPHGDAYRNLKFTRYSSFTKDMAPVANKLTIKTVDVDLSLNDYEPIYEKITYELSLAANLFVHDGAVGSFKDDRTRVRVISDNPMVAMFAQALLVRVPTKDVHATRPIVVYVATLGSYEKQDPTAYVYSDKDDDGNIFAKVVITGMPSLEDIPKLLVLAKRKLDKELESTSLIIEADTILHANEPVLLFNPTASIRAKSINEKALYSAHHTIWNAAGLTSLFGGALAESNTLNEKQLVPTASGVAVHVPCQNLVVHPKAAIFLDASSKIQEITVEQAITMIQEAAAHVDAQSIEKVLQESKTKHYVVPDEASIDSVLAK
uniref:Uncharacterized protein AlNc14C238G9436 n=1 Tax=Albugo laibachii Nc14 TaxID=890382 RepID=F0WSU0_9STRA|nr:conserved hypothetical protein [Albugo laibachii Nc14]|eukprot:CCA24418.1 conserved hypothetical protein [Albugo laibachii Nc14]